MTFHTIGLIVAGALMGLACILSFSLMLAHATHFSMPAEQRQYVSVHVPTHPPNHAPIHRRNLPPTTEGFAITNQITHLSRRIIRITFTIPVFAILSFLAMLLESRAVYLMPLTEVYEAFALGGFFFLLCVWIHPDGSERERILDREGKLGMYNVGWPGWHLLWAYMKADIIIDRECGSLSSSNLSS